MSFIRRDGAHLVLEVHVQPGARRNAISGIHGGRLKLKIASPPVDGEANRELSRFLARLFGVPPSRITVVRGLSSRIKTLHIADTSFIPPELACMSGAGAKGQTPSTD